MKRSKSLLKTTAAALAILHFINKAIDSASTAANAVKTSGKYYHWKHGDIFYKTYGEGKPLLLIHDLTVFSSSYEWTKIANELSDTYKVYTIDLIGCGKSDKPSLTYTSYFYVQLLSDFVKDVIGEKTHVAATGLSGSFVMMANLLDKDLFDEIMLVSPKSISSLKVAPDERSKILLRLFNLPIIGKAAYYIAVNKANTEYYLTEKCFYNPFSLESTTTASYYNAAHTSNGNGKFLLSSLDGHYLNIDISQALSKSENRIIIVNGAHREKACEIAKSYQHINENILSEIVEDANYLPQLENSGEMLKMMFLFSDK